MPEGSKNNSVANFRTASNFLLHLFDTKSSQKKKNVWSPMKKHKLSTWKHMGNTVKLSAGDKVMELQEDRSSGPYLRKWWWDASHGQRTTSKKAISQYEFPVVFRSMFAADGTMMHCSMKSNLMIILEKLSVKMAFGAPKRMNPSQLSVRHWRSRSCEGCNCTNKSCSWRCGGKLQPIDNPDDAKTC